MVLKKGFLDEIIYYFYTFNGIRKQKLSKVLSQITGVFTGTSTMNKENRCSNRATGKLTGFPTLIIFCNGSIFVLSGP